MYIDRFKVQSLMGQKRIPTFYELSRRMGVSANTLTTWFGGGGFHSSNLATLCEVLDCTPNDILTKEPPSPLGEPAAEGV